MKVEVTNPLKNSIAKFDTKVISIIVSFFISSRNHVLDLFNNVYMRKELINVY